MTTLIFLSRHLIAFMVALVLASVISGCERPPIKSVQWGYRGTAMADLENPKLYAAKLDANAVPEALPPADPSGPKASETYQNVQVLGDLSVGQFTRVMLSITAWVAPKQGCLYCHNAQGFQYDTNYNKVVARRMLQMTRHLNSDWKDHVQGVGVTCYTCHRGNNIPAYVWYKNLGPRTAKGAMGNHFGQNAPTQVVGLSSLPFDPFTNYLDNAEDIRMASTTALPDGNLKSIKQTEWTYALMMHFSKSLGVNCTYCHNSRAFANWEQSTPQRVTAWYGIRMVRDLNNHYLTPLTSVFPADQLGPTGDVAKIYCATCHQGAYKPLLGVSMAKDYPELQGPSPDAVAVPAATPVQPAKEPVKEPTSALPPSKTSLYVPPKTTPVIRVAVD